MKPRLPVSTEIVEFFQEEMEDEMIVDFDWISAENNALGAFSSSLILLFII